MNNPFAEPPKKTDDEAPTGVLIAVSAICMTCDEQCDEANWYPNEKMLVWVCTDGHRSVIENFTLGG